MKSKKFILATILGGIAVLLVFFCIFFGVNASNTSKYEDRTLPIRADLTCFSENNLYIAEKGTDTLYLIPETGDVVQTAEFENKIDGLFSADGMIVVALQNRDIYFLNGSGEILSSTNVGYPLHFFDYSAESKTMVMAASMSASQNYMFVFEDVDFSTLEQYSYYINPGATIVGVGINDASGDVYFASYNARVFRGIKGNPAGSTQLEFQCSQLLKNFAIAENGCFLFGMQNGEAAVYLPDYSLLGSVKVSSTIVRIAYSGKGTRFIAASEDGKLCFIDFTDTLSYVSTSGISTPASVAFSEKGAAAFVRSDVWKVIDSERVGIVNAKSWVVPVAAILAICLIIVTVCLLLAWKIKSFVPRCRRLGRQIYKCKRLYLMLLPLFGFLALFIYYPVIWGFALAFQRYENGVFVEWVFLENFKSIFINPYFLSSIGNMLIFLVTDLLKALIVPVIIAELLIALRSQRSQYAARVLMYVPGILPGVATMLLWRYGIYGEGGLLNTLFGAFGWENLATHDFLGSTNTALGSLIFMGFPWVGSYIIVYGALTGIPVSYKEAARLEGCSGLQLICYVDLPIIFAQLKYIFVITFIGSIQDFNRVYLTTEGGPGRATYVPALELYFNINRFHNYGSAAAMGIFLFIIIFTCSMFFINFKKSQSTEVA